jgi:hypothetical protein
VNYCCYLRAVLVVCRTTPADSGRALSATSGVISDYAVQRAATIVVAVPPLAYPEPASPLSAGEYSYCSTDVISIASITNTQPSYLKRNVCDSSMAVHSLKVIQNLNTLNK